MSGDFIRISNEDISYDDEVEEVEDFELDGYQVIRREFYAHTFDPAINLKIDSIQFNTACINKIESYYIHILINPAIKKMVVKECDEDAKDAIKWCTLSKKEGKRKPRKILCRMLGVKLFDLMKWNPEYKYKLQGNLIRSKGELLVVFSMNETEIYTPITKTADGKPVKTTPYYPEDWRDSFGLPVNEHSQSLVVSMLEGYQRLEYTQKRRVKQKKEEGISNQASIFDLVNEGGGNVENK